MASQKFVPPVFDNPFLNIEELPGDTIVRKPEPLIQANSDPNDTSLVISKDVDLDINKKTWLRIYVPRRIIANHDDEKLPVIFYYHGGGFVFFHANSYAWDRFCQGLAEKLGAMVIALEYRLAPENRLPAAYDDAMDALYWIKSTQDEWIRNYSDLSNVYLFGSSSGGNMAYHAGLRVASTSYKELEPVKIKGLILHQPYFSGKNKTESEEKLKDDQLLPYHAIDKMFDLSLPKGTLDHDHEYSNPFLNGGSKHLDDMVARGWGILVTGVSGDPLVDAARNFANFVEEKGIKTFKLFGDGYHAIELIEPSIAAVLFGATRDFISATRN
ncbi:probable carboxylesterase 120 [Solanum dulcamara]|uniref:probable carboxylesterase 120 n=1 Tax=Solanum dulcamara TaxID=45834 RepID=UPI0024859E84|nr:probable carboxylesterase 120 [Solanum dulcamara]